MGVITGDNGNNQTTNSSTNQSTGLTENGYTGSSFAGLLVIILFVIWFLYRMGIIGTQ